MGAERRQGHPGAVLTVGLEKSVALPIWLDRLEADRLLVWVRA
jgi:hypothetical protein